MTIVEYIESVLTGMSEGFTFLYADKPEQNLQDDANFPIAYMDYLGSDDTPHKTGALTSEYQLNIFFGVKSELDWTTLQHEQNGNAPMRVAAKKFINLLQTGNFFREIKAFKRKDVKNVYDVNITGCLLTVNVTLIDVTPNC